jgi:NADH:ubiquinone reductase (H+-translocating)
MKRIIILGGGFAGLWSAVGAARRLDELGIPSSEIEILLVDRTDWHAIRVDNPHRVFDGRHLRAAVLPRLAVDTGAVEF